jgi:anti-repressor protein
MNEIIGLEHLSKPFPVAARKLHVRLGVGRDYSNWIHERIERFAFVENVDYRVFAKSGENPQGGRPSTEHELTVPAAKMVAAIENTPEGRGVLAYLVKVEAAWNTPEMVLVRAQQAAQEIIERQKHLIAELEPDAAVARVIASAEGLKTISEIGKINGIGPRRIFELLALRKIIYRTRGVWLPYQQHIDAGRFVVREATYQDGDDARLTSQTYVTGKGEIWLAKQFFPVEVES